MFKELKQEFDLAAVKQDLHKVLELAPWEAESVRLAVIQGKVDGRTYGGECCCVKGIIAQNLGIETSQINRFYGIMPDAHSPMEEFLYNIVPGDTPETSAYSKFILDCLDEFIAEQAALSAGKLEEAVQAGLEEALAAVAGYLPPAAIDQVEEAELVAV
jgi:hypothetical protein